MSRRARLSGSWLQNRVGRLERALDRLDRSLAAVGPPGELTRGDEWLLDNYALIRRAVRTLRDEFPRGFERRLSPEHEGARVPRVHGLAERLVGACRARLDLDRVAADVQETQQDSPLSIAETWALPALLRLALLERLVATWTASREDASSEEASDGASVGDCVRSLMILEEVDWKAFFERVSVVDRVLREDPAGVYGGCDFETRDAYRKQVEELARGAGVPEEEVARLTVGRAAAASDPRERHVGEHLIGGGRQAFERALGYRPRLGALVPRLLRRHPTGAYLGAVAALTTVQVVALLLALDSAGAGRLAAAVTLAAAVVPAVSVAVALANACVVRVLPPRPLPKLDLDTGLPDRFRSIVAVPALLTDEAEVDELLGKFEIRFLGNRDPNLSFALLTDPVDADHAETPEDAAPLERAASGIRALNERYGGGGDGPFHLFHRHRLWNAAESTWMGWERKRGKLEEFNALLAGSTSTSFSTHVGDEIEAGSIAFVLTLDADTELPRGAARRLVETLAHPLNRARLREDGRVRDGYTVLQPRVEIRPGESSRTPFARLRSGDGALDPYSRAVSDVYQDLFGEGIYVGKGIYDVEAFRKSLKGRVPENALLSHDLFEGIHGRAGLVTDVVLLEDYPSHYLAYARRMHRWARGDWQLVPWLGRSVPVAGGGRARNRLSAISRWKMLDNLRRSLLQPALVVLLALAWLTLPGPAVWTAVFALALAVPPLAELVAGLPGGLRRRDPWGAVRTFRTAAADWLVQIVFLAHEAVLLADACLRTLFRVFVSRRHLLEWTSAAHARRQLSARPDPRLLVREMAASPAIAAVLLAALSLLRPSALPAASPFLAAWVLAPWIARRVSRRPPETRPEPSAEHRRWLRRVACRTWAFFEEFVGPDDQWLPPDHFQEDPLGRVAHRTSPTNIGLMLAGTLAAYDLGYGGPQWLRLRLESSFRTFGRLARHRGHLLNWYDTRSLEPLEPRYVSTVDSGNFAACLVVVKQGCRELVREPYLRAEHWDGVVDVFSVLLETVTAARGAGGGVLAPLERFLRGVVEGTSRPSTARSGTAAVAALDELRRSLDHELERLAETELEGVPAVNLKELQLWCRLTERQLERLAQELTWLAPWWEVLDEAPASLVRLDPRSAPGAAWSRLLSCLSRVPAAPEIGALAAEADARASELEEAFAAVGEVEPEVRAYLARLGESLDVATSRARELTDGLHALSAAADRLVGEMDFSFLYDASVRLLHIGFDVSRDRLDPHRYDLLASEARLASYLAIAKGDVPEEHWLHLGRRFGRADGRPVLMSWSGTMFEYLMPSLFLRQAPGSLLDRSCEQAVRMQVAYGRRRGVPWGISESGYHRLDLHREYQYRAFGVPGLGFKRGLEDDLVVAPYATALALRLRPEEAVENLARLESLGARGRYGFFEAVDFTPRRLSPGEDHAVVRSYMAHHQGMVLLALDDVLNDAPAQRRFHLEPLTKTAEFVIFERMARRLPFERLRPETEEAPKPRPRPALESWRPAPSSVPAVHLISNGRYRLFVSERGRTAPALDGVQLFRWDADPSFDRGGVELFLVERDDGRCHALGEARPAASGTRTASFSGYGAEVQHRFRGLGVHERIVVSPDADVDLRHVAVANEHRTRPRSLTLVIHGEVVVGSARDDARHPAFSKLFVESEELDEPPGLLFRRRSRAPGERPTFLGQAVVAGENARFLGFETDREAFLGRDGSARAPAALRGGRVVLGGRVGCSLDPVCVLAVELTIPPEGTADLTVVTAAGEHRSTVVEALRRARTPGARDWAFEGAREQCERALDRLHIRASDLPGFQRLLSAVLRPPPALRAAADVRWRNPLGQPGLWSFAVSGDHPIVLVRVRSLRSAPLLKEVLEAQAHWRGHGFLVDVVILNEEGSGYGSEAAERLARLARAGNAAEWLNRPGGVFLVYGDQVSAEQLDLLHAAARVVLDAGVESVAGLLERASLERPELPPLTATRAGDGLAPSAPPSPQTEDLSLGNGLGGFAPDGSYVIRLDGRTATPAPWANVVANPDFGFVVTESGGGFTWALNSGEHRLTPWRNDPVLDEPTEVVYLRDEETTEVWSVTPRPTGGGCEVRHSFGESTWTAHAHGLEQTLRLLVPERERVKVHALTVVNRSGRPRRLTVTFHAEWVVGARRSDCLQTLATRFDAEHEAILARNPWNPVFGRGVAFAAANRALHGFTTSRREFLGADGDASRPAALFRVGLEHRDADAADPCAALQVHLDLGPDETQEVAFLIGHADSEEEAQELLRICRAAGWVGRVRAEAAAAWDRRFTVRVRTPEPAFDRLVDRWLPYQVLSSRVWGRTGFMQSSGAFGFRDQLQDVLALVPSTPEIARAHLLDAAARQFPEGDVLHWWHPPAGVGIRTRCSDDLLWLPYAVAVYVTATGDDALLAEEVPYLAGEPLGEDELERYGAYAPGAETDTVYGHALRAIDRASTHGAHGLPLIGTGDWNDGMNRVGVAGRGESVWLAWFLCDVLGRFAAVCRRRGDEERADDLERRRAERVAAVEEHGWDGAWYRRAYDDDGAALGGASCERGQIDAISQSWAVLSGAGDRDRARTAMDRVRRRLIRDDGLVLLLAPPYDEGSDDPGYIRAYPPGVRENGGQYTHAAIWTLWAELELGSVDQAVESFLKLLPPRRSHDEASRERYRVEPYVLAGDVAGTPPHQGRGGWTWYTGSAAWALRFAVEGILGLTLIDGRWRVAPRLPSSWAGYEASVRGPFGALDLTVRRSGEVEPDGARVSVDGRAIEDGRLPALDGGGVHRVLVEIGAVAGRRVATPPP